MKNEVFVSVVTITYNSAEFVKETINSVLAQDYSDFEYIICDDCSSDNTWEIIQSYNDKRIKAFRNNINIGEYPNRNKCVDLATGKYLIFIDGDDVMYPHALAIFCKYARDFSECAMIIAKDWYPNILCPYKVDPANFYRFEYFDVSILGNFAKIMFKTNNLRMERFPSHIKTGDTFIQLKIGQMYSAVIIPDGLTWWRLRSGNASSNLLKNFKHHAESITYRLGLLDENCPLTLKERERARINIYGIYLRLLVYITLKFKFIDVCFLLKHIRVPKKYILSIFIPRTRGMYKSVTGDRPFH